jgi:DNA topoisomerase-1
MATRKKTSARKAPARKTATGRAPAKSAARKRVPAAQQYEDEGPSEPGSTSLVIVESPAKAKTIGKYLGRAYRVRATVGHIRDLPERQLGVDIEKGFEPTYVTIEGKEGVLAELKKQAEVSKTVYIATDPDREGEAIGWHVAGQLKSKKKGVPGPIIRRVLFHEITKDAVQKAIAQSTEIDERKVYAQQARRVLDRIVGYKASPLLWKTVKKGLSAGRVQTVALRILVEREREIRAFTPEEYWSIAALLEQGGQQFTAKLHQVDGKKIEIPNEAAAQSILDDLQGRRTFGVTDVKRRERRKNPAAPFTTSTLQQEAAKKLGFGSKRTMRLAQDLYEGIDVGGDEGQTGLITYMRTDSTRIAESAAASARDHLRTLFGQEFLADGPRLYGAAKDSNAQDAHEGVRPTDPTRRPDLVKRYLKEDQFRLYQLIWQRFMASQMAPAVFDTTTVDFDMPARQGGSGRRFLFRATGSVVKFQGFLALYKEAREETDGKALEDEQALPVMDVGDDIPLKKITPNQHFTEPPPRFSEASLVKELERLGIGRPSTYASIISVLVERRYVDLQQRRFFPTEVGETVAKVMIKQFPDIFDVNFTSRMEVELDKIAEGELGWTQVLTDFYSPFNKRLQTVDEASLIGEAHDLSALATEKCPDCGGKLLPKAGFFGPYVGCENHPKNCKFTRPLKGEKAKAEPTNYKCPECGEMMLKRQSRNGEFLGCSKFPKCRGTRSMPTGVKCPKDGGDIAERRSKARGKKFWGCENYPSCDYVAWDKPVAEKCPDCGYLGAEMKSNKTRGEYRKCIKCSNEWSVQGAPEDEVVEVA